MASTAGTIPDSLMRLARQNGYHTNLNDQRLLTPLDLLVLEEVWEQFPNMHVGIRRITPQEAARWLDEYDYDRQRATRWYHVGTLGYEIEAGRLLPGCGLIQRIFWKGRGYLVDGRHRLKACVETQKSFLAVVFTLFADAEEEIPLRYCICDTGLKRTSYDRIRVTGIGEEIGISSKSDANKSVAAIKLLLNNFRAGKTFFGNHPIVCSPVEEIIATREWGPAAEMYLDCIRGAETPLADSLRWRGVFAPGIGLFHEQRKAAMDFWSAVKSDSGLTSDMAESQLVRRVLRAGKRGLKLCKESEIPWLVALCWNHFFPKRLSMKNVVIPDGYFKRPIQLNGTQWDGSTLVNPRTETE